MNHTSVKPPHNTQACSWQDNPASSAGSHRLPRQCLTICWSSASLPSYHFKIPLLSPHRECKNHFRKLTCCHCVYYFWRIFWVSWPALACLPFPTGCGGKARCLSSPSQPSGHARQYLVDHKPRVLGINVKDGIAQESWLLPSAPAVLCTMCSDHSGWDLSSVRHYQKKPWHRRIGWGISPQNSKREKKSTGREDKKHLKFKLPRRSFSIITSILTLGRTWHLGLVFPQICDLLGRGGNFQCPLLRSCGGVEAI